MQANIMNKGIIQKKLENKQEVKKQHSNITSKKIVLLITASILPQEKRFLKVREPRQRLNQYLDSLKFYITKTNITKIVLCDNSGYEFPSADIITLAKKYGKKIEIVQFIGNREKIIVNGKGYGEGEIIEYALANSHLLREAKYFIKITGRIKVTNIDKIIEKMDITKVYMNKVIRNFGKPQKEKKIDTILYGIPKEIYVAALVDTYMDVCDKRGIYLEHVFYDRIVKSKLVIYNIPQFPVIKGVSGSLGSQYQETIGWERCLYELLSSLFLFNSDPLRDAVTYIFDGLSFYLGGNKRTR